MLDKPEQPCFTGAMSTELKKVTRATERRHKICAEQFALYVQAIRAARDAGHTLDEIGKAAGGITKNGVRYLLHPDPRKDHKP